MLDLHCTTWCENPDNPRSECHGWSSAPIYEFSAMVLGVVPTAPGYDAVCIKPYPHAYDLAWASGTVPTPHGVISVAWEKQDGKLIMHVTLPSTAMHCEVVMPDGSTYTQTTADAQYTCKL
jgi:hypothetical protein